MFVCLLLFFICLFVYCCLFVCLFTVVFYLFVCLLLFVCLFIYCCFLFVCLLLFVVVLCPDLVSPPNGVVMMTNRSVGSVAEYLCGAGFRILEPEQRTCLQNGNWSGREPSCEGKAKL